MPPLDLRGLKCPLPALLARRALMRAEAGTPLGVLADDPLAAIDIPHMCSQEGYEVLDVEKHAAHMRFVVRRPLTGTRRR
ncbi:MAG TPA: sulfurtransferase TusA family protein [Rhizomicrobium sp.]|jgi:tRNA 2-thiouridine synthesizing protein A|nr:sulfurtransferase TusA family protein [Rhizomicrobium sp.]